MYCILVTGIPASGKSTIAEFLSHALHLPMISKDRIKEDLFDLVGFQSREEKVQLGVASMNIMYHVAEQLMKGGQPFLLENNFEKISAKGLFILLEKYGYQAITVTLTGDYKTIYQRFLKRNNSPERHRGHVVNDCYPEKEKKAAAPIPYRHFVEGITMRGMDSFTANGPRIILDTTDFDAVDRDELVRNILTCREEVMRCCENNPDFI
ncbi:MAG: ATP-binding protein [Lachnospiraceae bacterium]|nr:ATP-binding protein [Lachnospiraceae bacterium]